MHLRLLTYLVFVTLPAEIYCTLLLVLPVTSANGGTYATWFWCVCVRCLVFGLFFNILKPYCRDMMGWLSVEKKAFQDGKWRLILARNWGNGMFLVSPKLENNQSPVAAGCPRHLNRCKRWLAGLKLNPHGGFLGLSLKKGMILLDKISQSWFFWNGLTRHTKWKVLFGNSGPGVLVSGWCKSESWSPKFRVTRSCKKNACSGTWLLAQVLSQTGC